jgi:lysyl-tRNA synthetase, class I
MTDFSAAALENKAWPFEEARKVLARIKGQVPAKGYVLFQTGYGPSGLPHIGTFGEVARTTMVRRAFELIAPGIPTKLIAFSDDMDGLRKVPGNIPNAELIAPHLGKPLTRVPDPFGTHPSFGEHNNARLRAFLDTFGFDYQFMSATQAYTSGRLDQTLLAVLANYEAVINIILPTLGPDRRATYSPFLPVCPKTGVVLQEPIIDRDVAAGTVTYIDPNDGERMTTLVTGGACKLQWKCDWAMRWVALDVDYEMSGKDLIESVKLSSQIARILGARPPEGFNYELFLDANGEKISKTKGNGLSIEEWLTYAAPESLALYMFQNPKAAKRLHFDVIPKAVDDYYQFLAAFPRQEVKEQLGNPVFHIHSGAPKPVDMPVSFGLLLNLVTVANTQDPAVLWAFLSRYAPGVSAATHPALDRLVGYALAYYRDFVAPKRRLRAPTPDERASLADLDQRLAALPATADIKAYEAEVYEAGKANGYADNLRGWFGVLYECLFGQSTGPRMGSFIALYGVAETRALIAGAISRTA